MDVKDFVFFRNKLGKTQKRMAQLLGTSIRTIESYEQGWRTIPSQIERQMYFYLTLKMDAVLQRAPCWEIKGCKPNLRKECPAWEFKGGLYCWFINGTICQGKPQENWKGKMADCKNCEVFQNFTTYWGIPSA